MDDLVRDLLSPAIVVDLGAGGGSFGYSSTRARVLAVDVEFPPGAQGTWGRVAGLSEAIPVKSRIAQVVVCNHTLEHFKHLDSSLEEIDRILKDGGSLWVSVPDASCLDDRLYRYLFDGLRPDGVQVVAGGHVNLFTLHSLIAKVEALTRLRAVNYKKLFTGFVYLNPPEEHKLPYYPTRARKLGSFRPETLEFALRWLNWGTRICDRIFRCNLSQYGWGVTFAAPTTNDEMSSSLREMPSDSNVCWHCGCGHPAENLQPKLRRRWLWKTYDCPKCGKSNIYSKA